MERHPLRVAMAERPDLKQRVRLATNGLSIGTRAVTSEGEQSWSVG